jgi:cytidine deaminase
MKQITITTTISVYSSIEELSEFELQMMQKAIAVRKTAYAPYSKFKVGVSLVLDNGEIVTGSNQENAAYPSGLCAERVAIFHAGSVFPTSNIKQMFISASPENEELEVPIPPCGACRQSIAEYEMKQEEPIAIFFMGAKGEVFRSDSLKNILPLLFHKKYL